MDFRRSLRGTLNWWNHGQIRNCKSWRVMLVNRSGAWAEDKVGFVIYVIWNAWKIYFSFDSLWIYVNCTEYGIVNWYLCISWNTVNESRMMGLMYGSVEFLGVHIRCLFLSAWENFGLLKFIRWWIYKFEQFAFQMI